MNGRNTEDFLGSENILYDTLVMDTCNYKFFKTHRMYNATYDHYSTLWTFALTGMAHLVEYHPAKPKVSGLIPGQGTCLGCVPGPPWLGGM